MIFIRKFLDNINNLAVLKAFFISKKGIILSMFAAGFLASFGFAPYSSFVAILAAYFVLFLLCFNLDTKKQVFLAVLLFFTVQNAVTLYWLNFVMEDFGKLPILASLAIEILFSFYLALPYAICAVIAFMLAKKAKTSAIACFMPVSFCLADFIVGYLFTGFPWMYIGNAMQTGPFSSYAPLIGVRGINLLAYIFVGALALTATRRFLYLPVAGIIFVFGILTMGIRFTVDTGSLNVVLVQGNIKPEVKWDPQHVMPSIGKYWNLTEPYVKPNTLIVWSESSIPLYIEESGDLLNDLNTVVNSKSARLITGIQHIDLRTKESFNSMILLGDKTSFSIDNLARYDKKHLVPFGEIVPFEKYLRPLGSIFNFPMSGFSKGEEQQDPFNVFSYNLLPVICYESIFPELVRNEDSAEINGIVMVSNDGWFGQTRGPLEHLAIAKIRALELQKPVLRSTNNGITAIIDAKGTVSASIPANEASVLSAQVTLTKGLTPYARFGNIPFFIMLCMAFCCGFIVRNHHSSNLDENLRSLIRP